MFASLTQFSESSEIETCIYHDALVITENIMYAGSNHNDDIIFYLLFPEKYIFLLLYISMPLVTLYIYILLPEYMYIYIYKCYASICCEYFSIYNMQQPHVMMHTTCSDRML